MSVKADKPEILAVTAAARSKLFHIEAVNLRFGNGREVEFERLCGQTPMRKSVIIIPMIDSGTLLFVREYAVGVENYVLRLPQGMFESGETARQAGNRELMEEVGYGARQLSWLGSLNLAPNWLPFTAEVVLARGLYPRRLAGDEPEPLEVVPVSLSSIPELVKCGQLTEASSLSALFLAQLQR